MSNPSLSKPATATWETLDWEALDRLRARFLAGQPSGGAYWESWADLASYDFTYAQRIGWKWDAVIAELKLRGWAPPAGVLLDWGCGSGIAGRCLLDGFDPGRFGALELHDRSPLALDFAAHRARQRFPQLTVRPHSDPQPAPVATDAAMAAFPLPQDQPRPARTLLVSHVLNELDEAGGRALRSAIDHSDAVIWVEPGTSADSRSLIAMREALRGDFEVVAPCTHQEACGLLAADHERDWCHHFAPPPSNLLADARWAAFSQRCNIDLRTIPYSFLVLERRDTRHPRPGTLGEGWSRIIGRARCYKAFAKIQSCQANGVTDLELQKRDCPKVFKAIDRHEGSPIYQWTIEGRWIRDAVAPTPPSSSDSETA